MCQRALETVIGIKGNWEPAAEKLILEQLKEHQPGIYEEIRQNFPSLRRGVQLSNENSMTGGFLDVDTAVFYDFKHEKSPEICIFLAEQYSYFANEIVTKPANKPAISLSQDGPCILRTYFEKDRCITAVVIEKLGGAEKSRKSLITVMCTPKFKAKEEDILIRFDSIVNKWSTDLG